MFSLFRQSARKIQGLPYVGFQKMFQLHSSSLYQPFVLGSLPDDSTDNPLALVSGIAQGIEPELSEVLENPGTTIDYVSYMRNSHDDWIVYGEYVEAPDKKKQAIQISGFFMMMFGAKHEIVDEEVDTYYLPYFIFDALQARDDQQALLLPRSMSTMLLNDSNGLTMNSYEFPKEAGMALCFADTAFCRIIADQPVDVSQCQSWVSECDDKKRAERIRAIQSRGPEGLRQQIESAGGRLSSFPLNGQACRPS